VQLDLAFLDIPNPGQTVWAQLDEEQRIAALDILARLIAQTAQSTLSVEGNNDD
jgi:hypothetical protein